MAYCQIDETRYVTYIFPKFGNYARYKILTQQELELAVTKCKLAGWKVINVTKLTNKMLEIKPQRTAKS
jgi:hypothetical protein